jgi:hypothetical protein
MTPGSLTRASDPMLFLFFASSDRLTMVNAGSLAIAPSTRTILTTKLLATFCSRWLRKRFRHGGHQKAERCNDQGKLQHLRPPLPLAQISILKKSSIILRKFQ